MDNRNMATFYGHFDADDRSFLRKAYHLRIVEIANNYIVVFGLLSDISDAVAECGYKASWL